MGFSEIQRALEAPSLVDADAFVYEIGFSTQKEYADGTRALDRSEEEVLQLVDDRMNWLRAKRPSRSFEFFLSDLGNFRFDLSTIHKYKDCRTLKPKPLAYQMVREYFLTKYKALVIPMMEGDDTIAMRATELKGECTILSMDKDLKQIPSKYYRWPRGNVPEINEEITAAKGMHWFFIQCLCGDFTVDGIPGIFRCGKKTADDYFVAQGVIAGDQGSYEEAVMQRYRLAVKKGDGLLKLDGGHLLEEVRKDSFKYTDWRGNELERTLEDVISEIGALLHMKRNFNAHPWRLGQPVHGV